MARSCNSTNQRFITTLAVAVSALGIVFIALYGQARSDPRPLVLATAKGIPYMVGLGMESVVNQFVKEFQVDTHSATTEEDVLRRLTDGRAQLGLITMAEVVRHLPTPEAREKARLSFVMGGHAATVLHVFVREELPIESIRDLRGRRVALPEPGSPAEALSRTLLDAVGLGYEGIKPAFMRVEEQAKAFEVGFADAVFMVVPVPSPVVTSPWPGKLAAMGARLLTLDEAVVKKVMDKDPSYSRHVVDAGTYRGQPEDLVTLSRKNALVARRDISSDVVYQFVKGILEHPAEFQKVCPLGMAYTGKNVLPGTSVLPLHPGAERYYREKRIL